MLYCECCPTEVDRALFRRLTMVPVLVDVTRPLTGRLGLVCGSYPRLVMYDPIVRAQSMGDLITTLRGQSCLAQNIFLLLMSEQYGIVNVYVIKNLKNLKPSLFICLYVYLINCVVEYGGIR